jgi:hypothetical protein
MNKSYVACICSLAFSVRLLAQAPTASSTATRLPEIQRLAYYLGTWKGEGETKGGPFGPAGKLSSTLTCDWFAGGFHLVCRGEEKGPTGVRTFLNILSYDKANAYAEYGISSLGESEYSTGGSIVGNKLTFEKDLESRLEGKATKLRYTEVQVSPTLYTYQAETWINRGPWMTIAEGKYTKVK